MVFEETASFNPRVGPSLNHLSALVSKVPAPPWFSHQNAQTHRPLIQQARPRLSHDQKNEFSLTQVSKSRIMFLHFEYGEGEWPEGIKEKVGWRESETGTALSGWFMTHLNKTLS